MLRDHGSYPHNPHPIVIAAAKDLMPTSLELPLIPQQRNSALDGSLVNIKQPVTLGWSYDKLWFCHVPLAHVLPVPALWILRVYNDSYY